jgi:endonuclease G
MYKKLLLSFIILTVSAICFSNEYISVNSNSKTLEYHNHDTYEVWYDTYYNNPSFVIWDLTFEDAVLSDSSNNRAKSGFKQCGSSAKENGYTKSGFDKGHMCPNNDRDWSKESSLNTFRACNICPQTGALNRGNWKKYEAYAHTLANKYQLVTIVCGPIYTTRDRVIIPGNIVVPNAFFKVFIINNKIFECYIFYQNNTFEMANINKIEKLTGLKFKIKKD